MVSPASRSRAPHPPGSQAPDLVCLSHLRWDFVYQRPQHLLSRAARDRRVFFIEEPVFDADEPHLSLARREEGVIVGVPHLRPGMASEQVEEALRLLLNRLLITEGIRDYVLWYYTPMALGFSNHLRPLATVYDVMDELSLFRGAPALLVDREAALFRRADVVFTGGASLYEGKRSRHANVHLFPSSIDAAHFAVARHPLPEPPDQAEIAYPRLGFFGVIDERMDLDLLGFIADARPDWQLVMVGPVVKIDLADLPQRPNIHYLGGRTYRELPYYIAGWNVALMPWAINEATRFISPTKTPEYLAAGRSVVSTPVRDVVHPYGFEGLVRIAGSAPEFVEAIEEALASTPEELEAWLARVDARLARTSWDRTWAAMDAEIRAVLPHRGPPGGEFPEHLLRAKRSLIHDEAATAAD